MSIEDEKQKYASQIVNALSGSPAINKEQAADVSIPESVNPAATIVQAINDTKPVPTIGLGSVLGLPGQAKLQAKLEKSKPLVDTSTGVNVEDTGAAEQKIATTRTLGINGPYDIEQRTYGLDEESMAAASSGTNEGDLHVVNLRAGNAGLNISTDSTLNPADGSDGNPAFFNSKYPLLQTKVMPFKVKIPAYDLEVMSETLDPDKLAYQVATMVAGRPIPTYIGYTNAGFDLTESWYSGQIKGWMNAPLYLADIGVKGGTYVGTASNYATAWLGSVSNSIFGDKKKDDADKRLEQNLEGIVGITDDTIRGWNKIVNGYKDFLGTDLTEYAGFWTSLNEALPTAVAQMGAAYGINVLATGMGVSPQASRLLAAALSGATYGTAQGGDTFVGLQGAAVSPMRRMRNATISAGGSTLLNSLGYLTAFTSKVSAARYYSKEYVKRLWGAGAGAGIKGFFGEGLTEVGDQVLQDAMTYNMGDDTIAARLDNYTMAFLLGGITGLMGIGSAVSAERQQIYKEQIIAGKLGKDAIPAALALNDAVDKLAATRFFTREQAYDFIELMASPEGQRALKNRQGEILMGLMDKLDPKAIQYAKSLSKTELQNAAKDFEMLDKTILKSLPATLDDSTKTMVSRAMSLIAPIISWYNNGNFKMPKFVLRDGSPMAYEPETNTIYINSKSSGESIDLGLATDKKQPLIDPVQRGILHELGHMMDYQINRGTNFKEFMPTYFEAIAKAFGKERADKVQGALNKQGDTFAFAESKNKADTKEKQADKAAGRLNVKNTTENFAYAIGRLGKKVGKVLNMSESEALQHVDAIMMMAAQLRIPSIQRQLNTYQKALTAMIKKNDATLQAMAKAQGNEELARHIRDFVAGDTNALSKEDVLALYDILKTYTGVDGAKIIDDAFDGVNPETFTQRVEREFADSIKESETTVGEMQEKIAKKNEKVKQETKKADASIGDEDLPNFDLNEQLSEESKQFAKANNYSTGKYRLAPDVKLSEQPKETQDAAKKLASKYFVDSDGFIVADPVMEFYGISDIDDVLDLTGDEFVNALYYVKEQDPSLAKKALGNYSLAYWGDVLNYNQLQEDVFDVSTVLNDNRKYVSNLEKRTNSKPTGKTYADDLKEVKGIIAKAGKPANWFTKMFANGDVNTALWSIGGKKLVDHFDLIGKMNRSSNASISYLEEFDGKLKKTMGFKNNVQRDAFENESSIKTIEVKQAVDPLTDENISVEISPLVAMNLYNTAKSKIGYQKVLRTFGGNEQEMNRVINSLTDEQKKYADAMMDYIKEKWDYYKKSYEQEGSEITEEPYWPIADAVHIALGDRKINSDIARKPDADGMISLDVDAREVFNHYIQRMSGAKENVYSTIQRIKDIFGYEKEAGNDQPTEDFVKLSDQMWNNSKKIRGMSQENIGGKDKYEKFLGLLDDFLAKREASLVGSESLNIAARNLTSGLLQWKPVQFMKNLANASGYWGLVPEGGQAKYWADTAWAATHPIEAAKYMFEKVPYLRNRFKGQNIDEALTQQTAGTDSLLMNWAKDTSRLSKEGQQIVSNVVALTQASRRLGFTPMLGGDMAANVIGGYGLLKQYETLYGDRAGDKLSEDIVMHQASNNQATRSLLQRQWSRDIRGELLRFGSEGVQKGKSMALAAAQAARGERSVGSATKEILSTMSSMILFALISAGVIDLFDSNDENDKEVYEALTREGISAIAGFSIIGNSIISPLVSIPLTGEMSTIGTPLTNILSSDLRKITKGDWESAVIHGIGSTVPVVGVDNLINEGRGVVRIFDEDERVRRSGLYMVGGRSQNYGEKRSGLK